MKTLVTRFKLSSLFLLGLSLFGTLALTGCTSLEEGGGRIGPDYDDPLSKQIRMQEAQSRVTRSLIR